jgi:uncharacterized protein YfbU (UPF0304 family)
LRSKIKEKMSFQISGKLVKKYDAENKSGKFMTREFVIVTEEQYPQYIKFQLVQDRCGAIDAYAEQEKMTVHFDLRGREWQDKYFTNLQAWKVEKAGESSAKAGEQIMAADSHPDPFAVEQKFDDLPF